MWKFLLIRMASLAEFNCKIRITLKEDLFLDNHNWCSIALILVWIKNQMASFFQIMEAILLMLLISPTKLLRSQVPCSKTLETQTKLEAQPVNCKKCNQEKNWLLTTQMFLKVLKNLPLGISYSNKINKTTVSNIFLSTTKTPMAPLTIKAKAEKNGWVNIKLNSLQSKCYFLFWINFYFVLV